MFGGNPSITRSKRTHYCELNAQLAALLSEESNGLANAANLTALFFSALPDVNWLGVYLLRGLELVLGPFQGSVACTRIAVGRGVCGAAAPLHASARPSWCPTCMPSPTTSRVMPRRVPKS